MKNRLMKAACAVLSLCLVLTGCSLGKKMGEFADGVSDLILQAKGELVPEKNTEAPETTKPDPSESVPASDASSAPSLPSASVPEEGSSAAPTEPSSPAILAGDQLACSVRDREKISVYETADLSGKIAGWIYYGSPAKVINLLTENGTRWVYLQSGNLLGYAPLDWFASGEAASGLIDSAGRKMAALKSGADAVRLRESASADARTVGILSSGRQYEVLEESGSFCRVKVSDSLSGYVSADSVVISSEKRLGITAEEAEAAEKYANQMRNDQAARELESEIAASIEESIKASLEESRKESSEAAEKGTDSTEPTSSESGGLNLPADLSPQRRALVEAAYSYVGKLKYVSGGRSLTGGVDSSGFTKCIYAQFGISIGDTTKSQRNNGVNVPYAHNARPGDLICYEGSCGIYIGNGLIVRAGTELTVGDELVNFPVAVDDMYYKEIYCVRNVFGD